MDSSFKIKSDLAGLDRFVRTLSGDEVVKVGIFGDKNSRNQAGKLSLKLGRRSVNKKVSVPQTNAEVGLAHEIGREVGKPPLPKRSFLLMPLHRESETILTEAKEGMLELMVQGNRNRVLARFGLACENAIQRAFSTMGFGTWEPNASSTVARKGSSRPLIDTRQLSRSITSKVEKP